jgi:hypothetical protein
VFVDEYDAALEFLTEGLEAGFPEVEEVGLEETQVESEHGEGRTLGSHDLDVLGHVEVDVDICHCSAFRQVVFVLRITRLGHTGVVVCLFDPSSYKT